MKRIFTGSMLAACMFLAFTASAQSSTKTFSFGIGLEAALPLGDAKEMYRVAPGLTLRGSYKVGPGFATLTTGALIYVPKSFDDEDTKAGLQIPVKAGYKYLIQEHFFVMGEIGFSSFKQYFDDGSDHLASVSQSGFTYAPSIGAQFGTFELALRYESTSLSGSSLSTTALRLGFNF